ncbi:MAG TPA: glycosyltransferase [Patescibacteria group bacterium]|nr:glycosyltransferase [Patescibacteria group bacterium]
MEQKEKKQPKIAIVCDWLTNWGGAERCIMEFHKIWPEAPIYTLIFNEKKMWEFKDVKIHTSYLQKMPLAKRKWQFYLNQMPHAIEQFDLSEYDIVFSNSHVVAKGAITKPATLHICYLDSPTRYLWDYMYLYIKEMRITKVGIIDSVLKKYIKRRFHAIRIWDFNAGQRPDKIIAISNYIRNRTKKYYRRDTDVIYPPVDAGLYQPVDESEIEDYYLVVGRQVDYKKTDIVIEAFNKLDLPLVIIGEGSALKKLKKLAKNKKIKFTGRIPDADVKRYYAHCRAFIFPQEEDFGITPLEAQSAGRPVIAYRAGGACETVIENETGVFFDEQTPDAIIKAVQNFDHKKFDSVKIREHALRFDTEIFKKNIKEYVEKAWEEHLEKIKY